MALAPSKTEWNFKSCSLTSNNSASIVDGVEFTVKLGGQVIANAVKVWFAMSKVNAVG